MKKVFCFAAIAVLVCSCSKDNNAGLVEKQIDTELGLKAVIKTEQGNDAILFSAKEWNDIERNLDYRDPNPFSQNEPAQVAVDDDGYMIDPKLKEVGVKVKLKIAARKYDCKKGVGFRCGGSGGPYAKFEITQSSVDNRGGNGAPGNINGRKADRMYDCLVKEVNGQIMIEFLEPVDWTWLAG